MSQTRLLDMNINNQDEILKRFNRRDSEAFGEIYSHVYKELYYFSYRLFRNTLVDCKDTIQDVFLKVWENEKLEFDSVQKIKSYLYVSINNRFKMHYNHLKVTSDAYLQLKYEDDLLTIYAAEAEVFSLAPIILEMLPEDCAESFKLYLEGYEIKEIAEKLKRPISTIYSQREKAIMILREKLPIDKLLLIINLIKIVN